MEGSSGAPMADASATEDPEIPEKKISATTTTNPSPPLMCPTRLRARRTSRSEIPPCSISPPARMKSGMARNGNVSMPEYSFSVTTDVGTVPCHRRVAKQARTMEKATGTLMASRTRKAPRRMPMATTA